MDSSGPYTVICPTLEGPVLDVFAHTNRPLMGREIARLASRGSERGVRFVLHRLVAQGLVTAREDGSASFYVLNREHVAAGILEGRLRLRADLIERIRGEVEGWSSRPVHVFVFGFAARADGDTENDIDLLMVRPEDVPKTVRTGGSSSTGLPSGSSDGRAPCLSARVSRPKGSRLLCAEESPLSRGCATIPSCSPAPRSPPCSPVAERKSSREHRANGEMRKPSSGHSAGPCPPVLRCSRADATDVTDDEANASVSASLAALAGIAACDAACCARLGRRSRRQDHHDAERLLTEIVPAGRDAAKDLTRLLDLKDAAQYGVTHVSATELRSALRRAHAHSVLFAADTVTETAHTPRGVGPGRWLLCLLCPCGDARFLLSVASGSRRQASWRVGDAASRPRDGVLVWA